MNIENAISSSVLLVVKELYGQDVPATMVQLQKTRSNFEGNLTLVVFPFLKLSKKNPEQTAQEIGEALVKKCSAVSSFNVVKGFLNLVVGKDAWLSLLNDINADEKFGEKKVSDDSPLVMIEYSSPNTNKPLHLGHVRNNLLGWSLAQIMQANGYKVVKTNIVNDRGIHICKSMLAWLKWGNGITPEQAGKKGDHLIGDFYVAFDKHYRAECEQLKAQYMQEGLSEEAATEKAKAEAPLIKEAHAMLVKWEQGDKEVRALWEKMNNWVYAGFDETYKALKTALDGGLSQRCNNVLVYATSNRRHLMPEYMDENVGTTGIRGEIHQKEVVEEKVSLSDRFGLWLSFYPFDQNDYLLAVENWLNDFEVPFDETAKKAALMWAQMRGNRSGRSAWQFACDWAGRLPEQRILD